MPLHTRRRVIEAVLNDILGLHNKPKAAVHWVHKVTGWKKKKEEEKKENEEEKEEEKEKKENNEEKEEEKEKKEEEKKKGNRD